MTLTIKNAVVGCMATFPQRFGIIKSVVEAVAPQLDRLYIYVNETTEGFPDLSHLGNVIVLDGRDHMGDLSANGKIYPMKFIRGSVVFTLDDDFIFPPDYVSTYLNLFKIFKGKCAITTHGSIFPETVDWYYERTHVFMSIREVRSLELCSLAGSGTFAFDQNTLKFDPEDFFSEIMVDLRLSLLARDNNLPIWVVPRHEGWLQFLNTEGLWNQFSVGSLTHHTHFSRNQDFSFNRYRQLTLDAMRRAGIDLDDLDLGADLRNGLENGVTPKVWCGSRISFQKRNSYANILLGNR